MLKRLTVNTEGTTTDFVEFLEEIVRNIKRGYLCGVDWDITDKYKYAEQWTRKEKAKELFKIFEPALKKDREGRYSTTYGYKTKDGMIAVICEIFKKL